MAELGLESSVLLAEYGPDLPVPVLRAGGDDAEEEANDQPRAGALRTQSYSRSGCVSRSGN